MSRVSFQLAVSLDGYVAGPDQSEESRSPIGIRRHEPPARLTCRCSLSQPRERLRGVEGCNSPRSRGHRIPARSRRSDEGSFGTHPHRR